MSLATASDGLLLRSDAIAAGCTDDDLRAAVRSGVLCRVRNGIYVLSQVWSTLDPVGKHLLVTRGTVRKARAHVVVSHLSAVAMHRGPMWELPLGEVHLTRPDGRSFRREAGRVGHRGRLHADDVTEHDGLPVTTPARTCLDLTTIVDAEHALPVIDDFLHRELVTKQQLEVVRRRMERWPGSLASDVTIRLADGRHESVGESRTNYLAYCASVPAPTPQFEVRLEDGRLVRLDFAWPELGVWIEFDGREKYVKHMRHGESVTDVVLREKRREEAVARATGWRCIRLTWADLEHPSATVALLRRVLAGGPVHV